MAELESDKIMYEIYREEGYGRRYRVVFFTELTDHNKEREINRALAGQHLYDGFIREWRKEEAKAIIQAFVERLNAGESPNLSELEAALEDYSVV
jgi:hypothetical protein